MPVCKRKTAFKKPQLMGCVAVLQEPTQGIHPVELMLKQRSRFPHVRAWRHSPLLLAYCGLVFRSRTRS
nr:MAG TPA: hypothetical protein [Caudoviricetes sp.]